ncbi:MAG: hypothetical protein HOF21_15920 [Nitrospina sp.]|nr:hypothetical protein [Nitrospina sp.]
MSVGDIFRKEGNKCITIALIRRIRTRYRSKDETVNGGMFIDFFCYVDGVFFGGIKRVPVPASELQTIL